MIQIKFFTGKFRKSCGSFKPKSSTDQELLTTTTVDKLIDHSKYQKEDYLTALDCYYEFISDHQIYHSVYDFHLWCRQKVHSFKKGE